MVLTSISGEQHLPRWVKTNFELLQRLKTGTIEVSLPDGRIFAVIGTPAQPIGRIDIAIRKYFTRLARDGDVGFPEMFMDGWWDSPDLQSLLDVLLQNNDAVARSFIGAPRFANGARPSMPDGERSAN
jgi:cyclopropane-fatty-acyl-phospholipid synthase